MNIELVAAAYFSATGNTERVVMTVAKRLAAELALPLRRMNLTFPSVRKAPLAIPENSLLVIGFPVYAGRLPNLLLEYVSAIKGEGVLAVPVVTYGNRSFDDGLMELRNILEGNGIKTVSAGAFVGEHAFSQILAKGRPDVEDLRLADELGHKTAMLLKSGWEHKAPVEVGGQDPIRPYYQPRDRHGKPIDIRKVKPVTSDACVRCQLCAIICPMGAIDPENVFETPGVCVKCCACEKNCPAGAKSFDAEGYLYHMRELEDVYSRWAESVVYCPDAETA